MAVDQSELLFHLQKDLVSIVQNLGSTDGILFLIDEADKPAASAHLGLICKLLTEALSRKDSNRLCIGLAGLPNLMENLKESHESSLRLFKTMDLKPLSDRKSTGS